MNLFKKYFWNIIKNHYADFKGRSTRKDYWMFVLAHFTILLIAIILMIVFYFSHLAVLSGIVLGILMLFILAIIIPSLALSVRRIHDIGLSGWWYLIGLIPYVGGIVLLVFYCLPSEKGENKWGQNKYGK